MTDKFDFSTDELADASLSVDQRLVWNKVRGELASAQAQNQELLERLRQYEVQKTDTDISVLSRSEFNREVARMLAFDERYGGVSSIMYFDFDGLENVSSRFGASVGNATLREIFSILIHGVRSSDIVGRLAGDEFGVLLMRCDNVAAWRKADTIAAHLQQALASVHDCKLDIEISYGVYTFRDNEDLSVGLKEAAQAMTRVKK